MLSETLKQLEQDSMLIRHAYRTVPPHIEYTLTKRDDSQGEQVYTLVDWLESNLGDILTNKNTTSC